MSAPRILHFGVLTCAATVAACAPPIERGPAHSIPTPVLVALEKSETIELISIQPDFDDPPDYSSPEILDYNALGRVQIDDPKTRTEIIDALRKGVASVPAKYEMPWCFYPRHGIRMQQEGQIVEALICFQCVNVVIFVDNEYSDQFPIYESAEPVLDRILTDNRIELAPK